MVDREEHTIAWGSQGLIKTMGGFEMSDANKILGLKSAEELGSLLAEIKLKLSRINPAQTKWPVFTGVPSSGKTTLICALAQRLGVGVFRDPARPIYDRCLAAGLKIEYLRDHQKQLQCEVTINRLSEMLAANPMNVMLQDYGVLCHHTWCSIQSIEVGQSLLEDTARMLRAPMVFFIQPLPREADVVRIGSDELHTSFARALRNAWIAKGHQVIDVPSFSGTLEQGVDSRVALVMPYLTMLLGR